MLYLFSPNKKFTTWRKLWIALAESEKELGLNITQEQIDEMKSHIDDIDYEYANFDTAPFEDLDEYHKYRNTNSSFHCLKIKDVSVGLN